MLSCSEVSNLALALSVEGLGSASLAKLAVHMADRDLFNLSPDDLSGLGLKAQPLAALRALLQNPHSAPVLRQDLARALGGEGRLLDLRQAPLPGLTDLSAPPIFLACNPRYEPDLFDRPRVAVVGTRRCSDAGRRLAQELGRQLTGHGVLVISGGADGIDSAAHKGAIEAAGPTLVILGGAFSLERQRDAQRFDWQWQQATVLSEQLFALPIRPYMYPRRNRLIAALAQVVIVVEGDLRSGAMITAEHARKLCRPLLAVPGHPHERRAQGPLSLLAQGARLYRSVDDVFDLIEASSEHEIAEQKTRPKAAPGLPRQKINRTHFNADEGKVIQLLEQHGGPLNSDQLAHEAHMSTSQLASILLSLELKGCCRRVPGQCIELT